MEKLTTKTNGRSLYIIIAFAVALILAFVSVSTGATASAADKPSATQSDEAKIAAARAWAKKTVANYPPMKSNPNPNGLIEGIGLNLAYARSAPFLRLNETARFIERARYYPITQGTRLNRKESIYKSFDKARKYASTRSTIRRGIVRHEVEAERSARVEVAKEANTKAVAEQRRIYAGKRDEIQKYRKIKRDEIIKSRTAQANKVRAKLKKTKKGNRGPLIKKIRTIQAYRRVDHQRNALRYSIKLAYVSSVRDAQIEKAHKIFVAEVQNIEDAMAKKTDTNIAFVNAKNGVEVSLSTAWRDRGVSALQKTPKKVVKAPAKK